MSPRKRRKKPVLADISPNTPLMPRSAAAAVPRGGKLEKVWKKVQQHLPRLPASNNGFKELQAEDSQWRCNCPSCGTRQAAARSRDHQSAAANNNAAAALTSSFLSDVGGCDDGENVIPVDSVLCRTNNIQKELRQDYLLTSQLPSFAVQHLTHHETWCDTGEDGEDTVSSTSADVTLTAAGADGRTSVSCTRHARGAGQSASLHAHSKEAVVRTTARPTPPPLRPLKNDDHGYNVSLDPFGDYVTITPGPVCSKKHARPSRSECHRRDVDDRDHRCSKSKRKNDKRKHEDDRPKTTHPFPLSLPPPAVSSVCCDDGLESGEVTTPSSTPFPLYRRSGSPHQHISRAPRRQESGPGVWPTGPQQQNSLSHRKSCDNVCDKAKDTVQDNDSDVDEEAPLTSFELLGGKPFCDDTNDDLDDEEDDDTIVGTEEDHLGGSVLNAEETILSGNIRVGRRRTLGAQQEVNGWYYLLTEEVGKKKHLQVSTAPQASRPLVRPRSTHSIPQINRDVFGLESVTIHIERGKNGFGFTVVDEFPVRVKRVDLASPAEEAGLKTGDFIIMVNNQNVSRSTVTSVARLVKKSGQILLLHINRRYSSSVGPPQGPPPPEPVVASYEKSDSSLWQRPDHIYESIANGTLPDRSEFGDDYDKENEVSMHTQFEISSVSQAFTRDKVSASTPLVPTPAAKKLGVEEGKKLESIHRLLSLELDFIDFMQLGIQRYSRPLRHRIFSAAQHTAVFQNIETLVNISEYHVQQIQENAPSLYPESDDDSQSSDDRHFASAVAMIYYSKAHMFCQAHEAYAAGLSEANCVLSEMRQNEKFQRFVKDPPLEHGQPSISAFIFRPLQHIKELWSVFQEIYMHTPSSSIDHATLKQVTHVLQASVRNISNMSNARVQSVTSLSSHTKSSCSGKGSSVSSAASSKVDSGSESGHCAQTNMDSARTSASLQTVRTMDREVMKMQDRLVFSQNVPVFQLCHEDRHIIYQGDVFFLHNNHWSKIQMTLLSDMVILCRPEADGSLHVLCDPIYLQDICHIHTSSKHSTELVLSMCPSSPCSGLPSTQRLVLRTPSPQDLSTWHNLLGQHCQKATQQQVHDSKDLNQDLPPHDLSRPPSPPDTTMQ